MENVNMQSVKTEKWVDLDTNKTLSDLYACAYSDFISGMEVAKVNNKKNIGMYTNLFRDYENILFERKHKLPSWRSDKFRSLSQPLIEIIKRDTNIVKTTELKEVIDSKDFRQLIGLHDIFRSHKDILAWIGLLGISEYYKFEIRKFKRINRFDIKKTRNKMLEFDEKIMPWLKIRDYGLNRKHAEKVNKDFLNVDVNILKELYTLYPEYKAILTGVKYSLLYYLSLTK